jgi:tetratricopeptide (TPR) repeat protein
MLSTSRGHWFAGCWLGLLLLLLGQQSSLAAEFDDCRNLLRRGEYEACIEKTTEAVARGVYGEAWPVLLAEAQLQLGRYPDAVETIMAGLKRYGWSIRLRWLLLQYAKYAGQPELGDLAQTEITQLVQASPWRYTDADNLVVLGRWALAQGADAKQVKQAFYERARRNNPAHREPQLALGELALDKQDYQLAADVFQQAVRQSPDDLDFQFGLARALHGSNPQAAAELVAGVLVQNRRHLPALLWQVDRLIERERYDAAQQQLQTIFEFHPEHPEAQAFQAVLHLLRGELTAAAEARQRGLAHWGENPVVDYIIGRELSQKYRFAEGAAFQRNALKLQKDYQPARKQLAEDLLRLGHDAEGWLLAREAAAADEYDVTLYNLLTLQEELERFVTLEAPGLRVRMDPREAAVYGQHVLQLLTEARTYLSVKYQVQLEEPTLVEIFPKPDDFAVRTFGLPGAGAYLGVCFGNVITANSPASQNVRPVNWESVLWHEYAHVITLNKTRNRMPRWLSEGISVYEERQRDAAWGERLTPVYRTMIQQGELTPIKDLSSAFLSPKSAVHVQFAYFQSSLVVEFLIENYGFPALLAILEDLGEGLNMNESLERRTAPLAQLEEEFQAFTTTRIADYGADVDWQEPDLTGVLQASDRAAAASDWAKQNPANYVGLVNLAKVLLRQRNWSAARPLLEQAYTLFPYETGKDCPAELLAGVYRELQLPDQEREILQQLLSRDGDHATAALRLLELEQARADWLGVRRTALRLRGIKPLIPQPHQGLVQAGRHLQQPQVVVSALESLLALQPDDPAELHFQLALTHEELGNLPQARRQVLMALENAPRYRAALQKLEQLVANPSVAQPATTEPELPPPVPLPERANR